jgi:hypothetical protein
MRRRFWIALIVVIVGFMAIISLMDRIPSRSRTYGAIHMCKRRIQRYAIEHNALPSSLSETKIIQGYDDSINDAWGFPIGYSVDTNGLVTLRSLGKDSKLGGTGDNEDMVGIYPSRQPNGKWSNEFVEWTEEPILRPKN